MAYYKQNAVQQVLGELLHAIYPANDSFWILFSPFADTLFRPSWTFTMFNYGKESFQRQDDGRHFDTTFSPVSKVIIL